MGHILRRQSLSFLGAFSAQEETTHRSSNNLVTPNLDSRASRSYYLTLLLKEIQNIAQT